MDSVSPHYENPTNESLMSFHSTTLTGDVSLINQVVLQLIKTIDIEELMTTYYQQIKPILPLTAVSLSCDDINLARGARSSDDSDSWMMSLDAAVDSNNSSKPIVSYWFSRELLTTEKHFAHNLHSVFCHPLQHALHVAQLSALATKDALTGLGNRGAFDDDAQQLRLARLRNRQSYGLLVLDMDNFKRVNDKFGHDEGDRVLREAAHCLTKALRANERAYRFGGDEFCCILETHSNQSVDKVAQRILSEMDNSPLLIQHKVSASIGGTVSIPHESVSATFKRADQALYHVKRQGKHGYLLS